jgi:hypothetical protein
VAALQQEGEALVADAAQRITKARKTAAKKLPQLAAMLQQLVA